MNEENEETDTEEINAFEIPALLAVWKYQAMDDVSCVQVNNPEQDVIANTSNEPKDMFVKDSATGKSAILAPGEDIIPSNIMRESAFDAKSFPMKYPSGNFALNFERPIKLGAIHI